MFSSKISLKLIALNIDWNSHQWLVDFWLVSYAVDFFNTEVWNLYSSPHKGWMSPAECFSLRYQWVHIFHLPTLYCTKDCNFLCHYLDCIHAEHSKDRTLLFCLCESLSCSSWQNVFNNPTCTCVVFRHKPNRYVETHFIFCLHLCNVPMLWIRILYACAGQVLNRFSKDVGFLDDLLPYVFSEFFLVSVLFVSI